MSRRIYLAIMELLEHERVPFEEVAHEAVFTAAEAAAARQSPVEIGAKSIVLKTDDVFRLFVMSGAASMRSRLIRKHLGASRTRFANEAELAGLTGLRPGAVPPFGPPILPLELFVDPDLLGYERIAFTPGIHTASILLAPADWQRVARPVPFRFTRSADGPGR